ncbi:glycosyltransferase family 4 protein [Peribacillus deserti]|uniref:Glycosyl transferase family 1 n=1 Tax=Peribacillus deserti TaxID=673318 RepID=A0A2N5MBR5_9BACI|nr:glycosyltransferase [Peribacillus deserti]PLT31791.1 glycosyl transferase family 1 [Peribacillus deserti]
MKILWLCNIPLPRISKALSMPAYNIGGWLSGLSESLLEEKDIDFNICFPLKGEMNLVEGNVDGINYFGFPSKNKNNYSYLEETFKYVINKVNPDLLHIFGTENPYALTMINAFNNPEKTVINIQGLVSAISKHYYSGLPYNVVYRYTLRDIIKRQNIVSDKKKFEKNGHYEKEAIKKVKNIIGRTDWDKACSTQINPNASYYHLNEILRTEFYNHEWDLNKSERNSIFISQAMYPIKGLHFVIKALSLVVKKYPEVHLYIAGSTIRIGERNLKDRLLMTSYAKYVTSLISKYNLENNITFTGSLDETSMCKRFLKSHVFVSASSLENESNSLSEAKILGVPSIASYVGGVTDRIKHKHDGFLYQHDAPYMLAYYICEIFSNDKLANEISNNARIKASEIHDRKINKTRLLEIYKDILSTNI